MVSLATAGLRFNSIMYTEAGFPFAGTIEPAEEGSVPARDFSEPRLIMRVSRECPIVVGALIKDPVNRLFLVASHDVSFAYGTIEHRTHRLYPMLEQVTWEREVSITDTLTGRPRSTGRAPVSAPIWCLIERIEREYSDSTLRVKEETRRLITGTELRLGDFVDGSVVKRIDPVQGVWLAEIQ